jgi:hypothetical protein
MSLKKFMINCKPQNDNITDSFSNPLAGQGKFLLEIFLNFEI